MFKTKRIIQCIDTHSCGEPSRVVVGGVPRIIGKSMKEKYEYFKKNLDYLRTSLLQEPRGFSNMLSAIITEPTREGADFGVIYTSATQYFEMCGDSTFSVTRALIETGMVKTIEPITEIALDTYGGIVRVRAEVDKGIVKSITYQSVPSFYLGIELIKIPEIGDLTADIAFGGLWYAFIDAKQIKVDIHPDNMGTFLKIGMVILGEINKQIKVEHPEDSSLNKIELITFYERDPRPGINYKIVNIYGNTSTCRSPAGTQSAARAAVSYGKGELKKGENFVIENGWIGSQHKVRVIKEVKIGKVKGILPELSATAYITGMYQAIIDEEDPYQNGFLL
ncbi:proline racemase [Candidatus Atribacteria bacterium HGW-Atribacteria-1]|nr:MAG: proline racemase [Candidatus Atribacteria bacterium HGW-Atribacteria-1]